MGAGSDLNERSRARRLRFRRADYLRDRLVLGAKQRTAVFRVATEETLKKR